MRRQKRNSRNNFKKRFSRKMRGGFYYSEEKKYTFNSDINRIVKFEVEYKTVQVTEHTQVSDIEIKKITKYKNNNKQRVLELDRTVSLHSIHTLRSILEQKFSGLYFGNWMKYLSEITDKLTDYFTDEYMPKFQHDN